MAKRDFVPPVVPARVGAPVTVSINSAALKQHSGGTFLLIEGGGFRREIAVEHCDAQKQEAGQRELAQLGDAAGVEINEGNEVQGARVCVQQFNDGSAEWRAAERKAA